MKKTPKRDYRLEANMGDPRKHKTGTYRRSDHADFATSSELSKNRFSGMRMNSITNELEFWVFGAIQERLPAPNGHVDDAKVEEVFRRIFAMY